MSRVRVTLYGGPLDGQQKHVRTDETGARFQEPGGYRKHRYAPDAAGAWRYVEPSASDAMGHR